MVNKSMLYNLKPTLIKYHLDRFKSLNAAEPDNYALVVRFASSPCFMVRHHLKTKNDLSGYDNKGVYSAKERSRTFKGIAKAMAD